jgi:hypothetical protein
MITWAGSVACIQRIHMTVFGSKRQKGIYHKEDLLAFSKIILKDYDVLVMVLHFPVPSYGQEY